MADDKKVTKEEVEVIQKAKGYVNVEYLVNHGTLEKGHKTVMFKSTADALAAHKIIKVGDKVKEVTKPEN